MKFQVMVRSLAKSTGRKLGPDRTGTGKGAEAEAVSWDRLHARACARAHTHTHTGRGLLWAPSVPGGPTCTLASGYSADTSTVGMETVLTEFLSQTCCSKKQMKRTISDVARSPLGICLPASNRQTGCEAPTASPKMSHRHLSSQSCSGRSGAWCGHLDPLSQAQQPLTHPEPPRPRGGRFLPQLLL